MSLGIYLPSIFTVANLGSGLYSILNSAKGEFTLSAWLIILSIVFDGIDGLIARATKTTSYLGVELDSFADLVSFCIAPALLMYYIVLKQYNIPGLAVGFIYVVFGAIRLAKYNIKSFEMKTYLNYFEGLPTPAAGGILASIVLMFELFQKSNQGITVKTIPVIMKRIPFLFNSLPVLIVILSFLMITKLHYTRLARVFKVRRISIRMFILFVVGLLLIISYPENIIFIVFLLYILSGIIDYLFRMYMLRIRRFKIQD